ncbi:MAG: hypothetical protein HKN44_15400 [Ilumatobacter sp.]|nr:hypothetical protein [Ilumatobacter sp.]
MNKKLTRAVLSATILASGVVGAGSIVAQASDDAADPTTTVPTADVAEPAGLQTIDDGTEAADGDVDDGDRRGGRGCNNEAVAEVLGLTTDELSEARESGSSLADIAAAQGVAVDDVVQAIVDGKAERIEAKVAAGDLTAEEAQERLDRIEERAVERVTGDDADS